MEIKKIAIILLIIVIPVIEGDYLPAGQKIAKGCRTVEFSLGDLDPRFTMSREDIVNALEEGAGKWTKAFNRPLFVYKPDAEFKIHFIYSVYQDYEDNLRETKQLIEDLRTGADDLLAVYVADLAAYMALKLELSDGVQRHIAKSDSYNKIVDGWMEQGGAPEKIMGKLEEIRKALLREREAYEESLEELQKQLYELEAIRSKHEEMTEALDGLEADLNKIVTAMDSRFTKGIYYSINNIEWINIYHFRDRQELVNVVTHELGHAQGLDHVDNPYSIMHPDNTRVMNLTDNDINELKKICAE